MKLKYGDFLVLACVALLAAGSFLLGAGLRAPGGDAVAEVWQDGRLVRVVRIGELREPLSFSLAGGRNTVVAEKGRIRFSGADCPDKVCVHTGWISRAGQIAACVPNRALIKIVGAEPEQDVVVR